MNLTQILINWIPFFITVGVFSAILWSGKYFMFTRSNKGSEQLFPRQAVMLALILVTVIAVVIALPIPENTQVQILSLLGLVISGLLAWSSTTVFSNLMAGFMIRFTKPFRTGDFIKTDDFFGRVTERSLLDCEIQTINRELVSIPNSWLISRPVEVIRFSGTIVSSTLSLGYEIHHEVLRPLLKKAATEAGLTDPFVHILELGNFAVTYRVSGLLTEVKNLLTTRSNLNAHILDCLHDKGIEIMSPNYMNQRRVPEDFRAIAESNQNYSSPERTKAEDIVFDKAEEAEQMELQEVNLKEKISALKETINEAEKDDRAVIQQSIDTLKEELDSLAELRVSTETDTRE